MHNNSGFCSSCTSILNKYPLFNSELRDWFRNIQKQFTDAHISCAGRGRLDQEILFHRGASKARYGQSAHNYNAAIDLFQNDNGMALWDREWFDMVVGANLTPRLKWYGSPGASFYELPHVELADWNAMAHRGELKLVE